MKTTTLSYQSHDEDSIVRALLWEPDGATARSVRGVIQIVHGMSEHIGRYASFAAHLTAQGFAVCAHDQVGHGQTAPDSSDRGHIPLRGGGDILIEDVHSLRDLVIGRLGEVPWIIFGHSMGSFVARVYVARHGERLAAAIICGTGQQPHILTTVGYVITHMMAAFKGDRYRSRLVDSMGMGSYGKAIRDARTELDWLCTDQRVVSDYINDPACGQTFSLGGYATIAALVADSQRAALTAQISHGLPMLFIAGSEDPVGDFGRGVDRAAEQYRRAGVEHVDEILYPHMRHEILNEPDGDRVERDIVSWLSGYGI